jgi:hypothetical protein
MDMNSSSKLMPQCQHIWKTEHGRKVAKYDNVCVPQLPKQLSLAELQHVAIHATNPGYQLRTHSPPRKAKSSNRPTASQDKTERVVRVQASRFRT